MFYKRIYKVLMKIKYNIMSNMLMINKIKINQILNKLYLNQKNN